MHDATQTNPVELLRELFVGSSVSGIRFGALQLLCAPATGSGELFINLMSVSHIFMERPAVFPDNESDIPDQSEEEEILSLFALRYLTITQVEIVESYGHLVVTFSDGSVLFVNGNNLGPEPWHAGLNAVDRTESISVIAISGDHPLVYMPFTGER